MSTGRSRISSRNVGRSLLSLSLLMCDPLLLPILPSTVVPLLPVRHCILVADARPVARTPAKQLTLFGIVPTVRNVDLYAIALFPGSGFGADWSAIAPRC